MNARAQVSRPTRILKAFASLKLTRPLLLILAVLCVLGTLIPQHEAAHALNHWPDRLLGALSRTGVFHLYTSPVFLFTAVILGLNLTCCLALRLRRNPLPPLPAATTRLVLTPEQHEQIIEELDTRYRVRTVERGNRQTTYAIRGLSRRTGMLLVHASILLIMAGMVMGSLGTKARMEIPEGATTSAFMVDGQKQPLDFAVRCDDFTVSFYDNGAPREYESTLSFIADGAVVKQETLKVNHPVKFGGLRFYQASYAPAATTATVTITGGGSPATHILRPGSRHSLGKAMLVCERVEPDFMKLGPAVRLRVEDRESAAHLWIFADLEAVLTRVPDLLERAPVFNPEGIKPYTFHLDQLEPSYATGLMVNSDPGVPLVAAGAVLLLAGLIILYGAPRTEVWLKLKQSKTGYKGEVCVQKAGRTMPPHSCLPGITAPSKTEEAA